MKQILNRAIIYIILSSLLSHVNAQFESVGIPFIEFFSKEDYGGGPLTWEIQQDQEGRMYFANNGGLLIYDGNKWQTETLPNQTNVRSLWLDETAGRIYLGGQNEFGYFHIDPSGCRDFVSLDHLLPKEGQQPLEDIWGIHSYQDKLLLQTSSSLFFISPDEETVETIVSGRPIVFLDKVEEEIYVHDYDKGILRLDQGKLVLIPYGDFFAGKRVRGIGPFDDHNLLISTVRSGAFYQDHGIWQPFGETSVQKYLQKNLCYSVLKDKAGNFSFGTTLGGLLTCAANGKVVRVINRKNGLRDNNIISQFQDHDGNVWLGLNYGISLINYGEPFINFNPDVELISSGYTSEFHNNQLFLGTTNGLFKVPFEGDGLDPEQNPYQLIKKTQGQVWGLKSLNDKLFIGHQDGPFYLDNKGLQKSESKTGTWNFFQLPHHPGKIFSGTYNGFEVHEVNNGNVAFSHRIEGLNISCRIVEVDENGTIWMAHPYQGLYKIEFSEDLKSLTYEIVGTEQGFPSSFRNYVFQIHGEIVFGTEKGVYRLNQDGSMVTPYEAFNEILGSDVSIERLKEDQEGNIWYSTSAETGIIRYQTKGIEKSWKKEIIPIKRGFLVGGFEWIHPLNGHECLFGTETGFSLYQKADQQRPLLPIILSDITVKGDSTRVLYCSWSGNNSQESAPLSLHYKEKNLAFQFCSPYFASQEAVNFRFRLMGLSEVWEESGPLRQKEYSNLNSGNYRFEIQAFGASGKESAVISFPFTISPPWYGSTLAIITYLLIVVAGTYFFIWQSNRNFEKEKARLESENVQQKEAFDREIVASEQQIIKLKNEKLESEIAYKNQELASTTMHLVQKSELIQKIRKDLEKVEKNSPDSDTRKSIRSIIHLLQYDSTLDQEWEQFTQTFNQVHQDFLNRIKSAFPQLTPKDQKLCAYLRMNLSTKEIAPLMNISVRGVEISRYRLRKKMELDKEVNLNEFMMNF
ncbi:MAG: triple tyrosine motif-containing protein [Bacteroidota bacterium]